jgi:predicted transcriptional regulator
MQQISKTKEIVYTLEFTQEDAIWLKSVMQNPLNCVHPEDEDPYHKNKRQELWEALSDVV